MSFRQINAIVEIQKWSSQKVIQYFLSESFSNDFILIHGKNDADKLTLIDDVLFACKAKK